MRAFQGTKENWLFNELMDVPEVALLGKELMLMGSGGIAMAGFAVRFFK
jgi:hypothetical protein